MIWHVVMKESMKTRIHGVKLMSLFTLNCLHLYMDVTD